MASIVKFLTPVGILKRVTENFTNYFAVLVIFID